MKHFAVVVLVAGMLSAPVPGEAKEEVMRATFAQRTGALFEKAVQSYIVNPFGDVDGLLLADGWLVKFPAHQSSDITSAIKPGDTVAVAGMVTGPQVADAWTLTNTVSNAVVARTARSKLLPKLPKHLRAISLRQLDARGRISHVVHGKKGEVKLAVLEDGTTLRFGKQARWTIGTQLAVGHDVVARGVGTENSFGRALEVTELGVGTAPVSSLYGVEP